MNFSIIQTETESQIQKINLWLLRKKWGRNKLEDWDQQMHNDAKAFDCVDHNKLWKILRDGNTRPPGLPLRKSVWKFLGAL